ncbi:DUF5133 domain-containing protein [Streptomyces sp. NPDC006259]|uniref:DUF5133 domain-containing protein n=1 Tax=Streptomyces sp. NPDC006259 TaxID=3364740 RepID=UPI003684F7BC
MLMPHPAVLRTLVAEYEAATATGSTAADTRAQDLAYTLCVSTGTREVTQALEVARSWLTAAAEADAPTRRTIDAPTRRTPDVSTRRATDAPVRHSTDDGPRVYA